MHYMMKYRKQNQVRRGTWATGKKKMIIATYQVLSYTSKPVLVKSKLLSVMVGGVLGVLVT